MLRGPFAAWHQIRRSASLSGPPCWRRSLADALVAMTAGVCPMLARIPTNLPHLPGLRGKSSTTGVIIGVAP